MACWAFMPFHLKVRGWWTERGEEDRYMGDLLEVLIDKQHFISLKESSLKTQF